MLKTDESYLNFSFRVKLSFTFVLICFFILLSRLWYLQILRGEYYYDRSVNNQLRTIEVPGYRGLIYDRNNHLIVGNVPSFNIEIIKDDIKDLDKTIAILEEVLDVPSDQLRENLKKFEKKRKHFAPQILLENISFQVVAKISANTYRLPGVVVRTVPLRDYKKGRFAGHSLGYLREINNDELKSNNFINYSPADLIGKGGVEKKYEKFLKGKKGLKGVIVNAKGVKVKEEFYEKEKSGNNIILTIDYHLQSMAEKIFKDKTGVAIVIDVNSGEILSLLSKPDYDPNLFNRRITKKEWEKEIKNKNNPLLNRAISGTYPPGSLFKPFLAVAALEEGILLDEEKVQCLGSFQIGKTRPFHCHNRGGHGYLTIEDALKKSCNVYFYTMGQRLGIDRIHKWAKHFGFASQTGIDLEYEKSGLIPSRSWKKKLYKRAVDQKWYPGETPSVSIGQGAVSVTPLQLAVAYSAIANGGKLFTPKLVKDIKSVGDNNFNKDFNSKYKDLNISQSNLDKIKEGLFRAVNSEKGTAKNAKLKDYLVAGKTGTAQVRNNLPDGTRVTDDHAWFAGFAPFENPEIAVVVLIEKGGKGGQVAAPIGKKILQGYFNVH